MRTFKIWTDSGQDSCYDVCTVNIKSVKRYIQSVYLRVYLIGVR